MLQKGIRGEPACADYVLTGIYSGKDRQNKGREPDDENGRNRVIGGWQAADIFQDIKTMTLDNVVWERINKGV